MTCQQLVSHMLTKSFSKSALLRMHIGLLLLACGLFFATLQGFVAQPLGFWVNGSLLAGLVYILFAVKERSEGS